MVACATIWPRGGDIGDYLAVTVGLHEAKANGWPVKTDPACVADWDSVAYSSAPHCLRTLTEGKHVCPEEAAAVRTAFVARGIL